MSKSLGNVLDPFEVIERYGTDALRFYCFREVSFGAGRRGLDDGFATRYETELANEYGNLASRTLAMIARYRDGVVPEAELDPALAADFDGLADDGRGAARPRRDHAGARRDLAARAAAQPLRRGDGAVEARQGRGAAGELDDDAALARRGPARRHRAAARRTCPASTEQAARRARAAGAARSPTRASARRPAGPR